MDAAHKSMQHADFNKSPSSPEYHDHPSTREMLQLVLPSCLSVQRLVQTLYDPPSLLFSRSCAKHARFHTRIQVELSARRVHAQLRLAQLFKTHEIANDTLDARACAARAARPTRDGQDAVVLQYEPFTGRSEGGAEALALGRVEDGAAECWV